MAGQIELWVKYSSRNNIKSITTYYQYVGTKNFLLAEKEQGAPTFKVDAGRPFHVIWAMLGGLDGTGSVKVELMRGSTVLKTSPNSKVTDGVTGGLDWFENVVVS